MNRNIKSIDNKIDAVQQRTRKAKREIQRHQEIMEKQSVKNDMLNLLDTVKHYNASYYYHRDTKQLSEIEALRTLNRRIKFPEVEQKINSIFRFLKDIKSEIDKLENDDGLFAKILRKKTQENIANERKKLSEVKHEYRKIRDLYIRVQNGRELLNKYSNACNKLTKLNMRLKQLREKRELDFQEFKKHELAYAKAASHDLKTREQARKIKKEILSQIKKHPFCPYCQSLLGDSPHADHIYPVSKGGLSMIENMVYICSDCNLKKSDLTLREFMHKYNINRDETERILEKLSKKF